jgi:hypothetical protein
LESTDVCAGTDAAAVVELAEGTTPAGRVGEVGRDDAVTPAGSVGDSGRDVEDCEDELRANRTLVESVLADEEIDADARADEALAAKMPGDTLGADAAAEADVAVVLAAAVVAAVLEVALTELADAAPAAKIPPEVEVESESVGRSLYVWPYGFGKSQTPSPLDLGESALSPPPYSTSGPGSGKTGSTPSVVVQLLMPSMFAFQM